MIRELFKFDVNGEIAKLNLVDANLANLANHITTDSTNINEISNISRISNVPTENSEIEDIEKLINRISTFYGYLPADIGELKDIARNEVARITKALREQVVDIELLEAEHISWDMVPVEFEKLVYRLCEVDKYQANKKEALINSVRKMSTSQMLREIKILRELVSSCSDQEEISGVISYE